MMWWVKQILLPIWYGRKSFHDQTTLHIFLQCTTIFSVIVNKISWWVILAGKLDFCQEVKKFLTDILIQIMILVVYGHQLFFLLNPVPKVCCMRSKLQVEEKFIHQVEDFGVVAKKHLKNGKPTIGFGSEQMEMAHHERKLFCQKYNQDYAQTRSYFKMMLETTKKQNKKLRHSLMV